MSTSSSTTIERLHCRYLVPAAHPAPDDVRSRLDMVARSYLSEVCSRWLTQLLDPNDPAVWLIRQLNIDVSMDISTIDTDRLAEVWGRQMALSIIQIIAAGADDTTPDTVRYYRNQAIYTAHFSADLAEGHAVGKWYYHPFDSLSSLPTSAALRTALTRHPEQITETLLYLASQKRLEPVLQSLSESDAQRIYEQCLSGYATQHPYEQGLQVHTNTTGSALLLEDALSIWANTNLELTRTQLATPHNALRLFIAMRERSTTLDTSGAHTTISHLLRFAEVVRGVTQPTHLVAHLIADNLTGTLPLLREAGMLPHLESVAFLQQVALGDAALIRRTAATVSTSAPLTGRQKDGDIPGFTTPMGGLFLLMPSFLALQLHELLAQVTYPHMMKESLQPILRCLVLLKCMGLLYTQWPDSAHDPALLLLAGLEEAPSPDTLLHFNRSTPSDLQDICLLGLLERLARQRHLDGRYLFVELVASTTDDPILLLRDMTNDSWIYASYLTTEQQHSIPALLDMLIHGITLLQKTLAMEPEYLLFDPGFEQIVDVEEVYRQYQGPIQLVWTEQISLPGALSHTQSGCDGDKEDAITLWTQNHALPQEIQKTFMRYLRRIQPASKDFDYMKFSRHKQPLIDNRDIDLICSLLARALMRAFARRLMGFDQSSMPYLYHNFLAGSSAVQTQQDLLEVRLPCSPLHTILRMAGVNGQSYALPWLNNTQVTLELPC